VLVELKSTAEEVLTVCMELLIAIAHRNFFFRGLFCGHLLLLRPSMSVTNFFCNTRHASGTVVLSCQRKKLLVLLILYDIQSVLYDIQSVFMCNVKELDEVTLELLILESAAFFLYRSMLHKHTVLVMQLSELVNFVVNSLGENPSLGPDSQYCIDGGSGTRHNCLFFFW